MAGPQEFRLPGHRNQGGRDNDSSDARGQLKNDPRMGPDPLPWRQGLVAVVALGVAG